MPVLSDGYLFLYITLFETESVMRYCSGLHLLDVRQSVLELCFKKSFHAVNVSNDVIYRIH
jgi:hypothetical protein